MVTYLVILQGPGVKGPAQEKLSNHTAQGPHVYGFTKWQSQNNFWSPVEMTKSITLIALQYKLHSRITFILFLITVD